MPNEFELGTFEHVEAQLHELDNLEKGDAFESLCCELLRNAPVYRNQVKQVWLWKDWPGQWGRDLGIDIIVETHAGKVWAVQAKAIRSDRSVTKREVDSFLSESNRPEIDFRLLITTTNSLGHNARKTFAGQEKPAGFLLREDLATSDVVWPTSPRTSPSRLPRYKPRPHQKAAIRSVGNGFQKHDRGQLITPDHLHHGRLHALGELGPGLQFAARVGVRLQSGHRNSL